MMNISTRTVFSLIYSNALCGGNYFVNDFYFLLFNGPLFDYDGDSFFGDSKI